MRELWSIIKRSNLGFVGREGEKVKVKGRGNVFNKIIAEIFPDLEKEIAIQVQKTFRTQKSQESKRIPPTTHTPHDIIGKTLHVQNK
jgi:hypothetical protein